MKLKSVIGCLMAAILMSGCYTAKDLAKERLLGQLEQANNCANFEGQVVAVIQQMKGDLAAKNARLKELGQFNQDGSLKKVAK